ncbi:MAG TPA: hypothetical protein VFZ61_04275, partial [Polyangiales bacterium]
PPSDMRSMGIRRTHGLRPRAFASILLSALLGAACEPDHAPPASVRLPDAGVAESGPDAAVAPEPIGPDEPDASEPPPPPPDAGPVSPQPEPTQDAATQPDAAAEPAPPVDVCGEVSSAGHCLSPSLLELCVVATGASPEQLVQVSCATGEQCVESLARARCAAIQPCSEGASRCAAGGVETCSEQRWQLSNCAGECVATPLGAWCSPQATTRVVSGRVEYERRLPNAVLRDWGATELTAARGFLVLSYHGEELVDATLSAADGAEPGSFSLRVPAESSEDDSLVVMAAGVAEDQQLAFAVADPGFTPSSRARGVGSKTANAAIWSYRFAVDEVERTGRLAIREQHGSGACHVFDRLRQVYALARDHYQPPEPERVLVWLGMGTEWSCGACSALSPVKAFDSGFQHQVWLDGSRDEGYWSDPVTAHELGHYVMNAYGYPAGEGGPHYLGVPTHPGQAFSEGWATFFASMARDDSLYFDKQGGAFFWWDLDRRAYSAHGVLWLRALAALGLLQRMDENEVAAILWQSYGALDGPAPLLDALASERMTRAPFARGYTRRIWEDPEEPEEYESTSQPLPFLADYLDALRCSGTFDAAGLRAILEPTTYFPYPTESPLCR